MSADSRTASCGLTATTPNSVIAVMISSRCAASRPKMRITACEGSSFMRPTSKVSISNSPSRSITSSMMCGIMSESMRWPSIWTSSYGLSGM